jgi:sialate O-acetylesterase
MNLTSGLFDHMVLQRTRRNVCNQTITGTCRGTGPVSGRVTRNGRAVRGFAATPVGTARRGRFTARLKGLPVGGPYDITLTVNNGSVTVRDVLVGDVWVLAGQSNMEGIGLTRDALAPVEPVRAFYMDNRWDVAKDPLHDLPHAAAPVHAEIGCGGRSPKKGVGPGVAFGQELQARTGIPQGLIASAHGGTSMAQWDPRLKRRGDHSLYGATINRVRMNGGRVAGIFWYQGCSDANRGVADVYTRRMKALMRSFRRDFGDARLPVVIVQIGRFSNGDAEHDAWMSIREQQRLMPRAIDRLLMVPAIDLGLDDLIHISGRDQHRIGRRAAEAMQVLRRGRKGGRPPIELRGIRLAQCPINGTVDVIISFTNVVDKLVAAGRPWGFAVTDGRRDLDCIYDVQLRGSKAIVKTALPSPLDQSNIYLCYGYRTNPYCNITDSEDRAVPAFGPLALKR